VAWLSNREEKSNPGNDLLRLRFHLNTYSTQVSFLLQKFAETISLKSAEMGWVGTSTEIDSV
jgi:RNA:NAD 2'-phosphotransferase (TPT1/KptA family)